MSSMKISEVIEHLKTVQERSGDVNVYFADFYHYHDRDNGKPAVYFYDPEKAMQDNWKRADEAREKARLEKELEEYRNGYG